MFRCNFINVSATLLFKRTLFNGLGENRKEYIFVDDRARTIWEKCVMKTIGCSMKVTMNLKKFNRDLILELIHNYTFMIRRITHTVNLSIPIRGSVRYTSSKHSFRLLFIISIAKWKWSILFQTESFILFSHSHSRHIRSFIFLRSLRRVSIMKL